LTATNMSTEIEREGYREFARLRKTVRHPIAKNPYPYGSTQRSEWDAGFDLAEYDDLIGDLEDDL
jgi:hypothetical protein